MPITTMHMRISACLVNLRQMKENDAAKKRNESSGLLRLWILPAEARVEALRCKGIHLFLAMIAVLL